MSKPDRFMHVGPRDNVIEQHVKQRQADDLRADIEAFQAKGGHIEVLGTTPRRDLHDYKKTEKARRGGRKGTTKNDQLFRIGQGKHTPVSEMETDSLDDVAAEEEALALETDE